MRHYCACGLVGFAATIALFAGSALVRAAVDEEALRKEALKLNDVVGDNPIKERIATLKNTPEHAKKLIAAAINLAKGKEQPFNYNGAYILANAAEEVKDVEACKIFYRICIDKATQLKSVQKTVFGYRDLAYACLNNEKYDDAEKVCKEFLEIKDEEIAAYDILLFGPLIQAYAYQGKNDDAHKQLKVYEQEMAKRREGDGKDMLRQNLANLYLEVGDVDKTTEHLQALLKKKPDDPGFNNDLGYIWADHDRNLEEAEKMIQKAIDQKPDSAAYLDSMGWVKFKQKKYVEAKEHLQKAIKAEDGKHAEIFDHLGDVHKALNEKEDAVSAWKKAIEHAGASHRELKRKKAIEKKLMENS